jgi:hypothetical protein
MKSKLLVLLALLVAPAVATPDKLSVCKPQMIVRGGWAVEGKPVPAQTVELVIPCVSKADLGKMLADLTGKLTPDEVGAVQNAKAVQLLLTTGPLVRPVK